MLIMGCSSTKTNLFSNLDNSQKIDRVTTIKSKDILCIKKNKEVKIIGFLPVMQMLLKRNNVDSELVTDVSDCSRHLTYTAKQATDGMSYLSYFNIVMYSNNIKTISLEFQAEKNQLLLQDWNLPEMSMVRFTDCKYETIEYKLVPAIDKIVSLIITKNQLDDIMHFETELPGD